MSKVSIIVPVYNSSKYLEKCITSLSNQTLKDIKIIMINDGSTDDSEKIIKKFQKKDNRIKLINKENGGQASARNLGLEKAEGEYVAFIDSDDYVEEAMCEEMYNLAKKRQSDIVVSDYYIDYGNKLEYKKILKNKKSESVSPKEYFFAGAGPCNKIYKTSFLKKINFKFPEGIIYEDYAVIPALAKYEPKITYIEKAYSYYVQSDSSTMRNEQYKEKYENIFEANEILYNSLKDSKYIDELEFLIIYHMLYLGSLNFYKYKKYDQIDKISDFIKKRFPKWNKNIYLSEKNSKEKILMKLFYRKKYKIISLIQKIKRCFNAR